MAERLDPTPEQRRAIEAPGDAVVRAGAGCGKTAVLAGRFVELLRPGPDGRSAVPDVGQILAITFTEKAAAEMKKRIRALVSEAADAAGDGERGHWERVRRELLGAQISTIHAVCARVLREHPLEAGIDPHAVVLDEHDSRDYRERAVEAEILQRLAAGDPVTRRLVARARGLHGTRGHAAVPVVVRLLDTLARLGLDGGWLLATTRQYTDPAVVEVVLDEARSGLVTAVETWLATPAKTKIPLAECWAAWKERVERVDATTSSDEFMRLRDLGLAFGKQRGSGLTAWLQVDGDRMKGTLASAWGAAATAGEARATAELVADVERALAARKRADGVLTFDDLVRGAESVMASHPTVARRYGSRFRALLVDEFQDTDAVQAKLIAHVAAGADTSLFVVGDEKQSIYRFRGADVSVFADTSARVGTPFPLGRNFRSQPDVLAFVNALAAEIFRVPAEQRGDGQWVTFEPAHRLSAHRAQRRADAVRLVTFAALPEVATVSTAREIEARVLAEVLVDLRERAHDPVGYGDIAVLFRTLNQVKAYEYALARRGVPYYVVKGRGFFQCQEVRDLANLLAAIAQPSDDLALAAVLRSPLFGLDDDALWRLAWPTGAVRPDLGGRFRAGERFDDLGTGGGAAVRARDVLSGLRALHGRSHIAETLVRALAATDLEAVYLTQFQGRQKVANVRKVIELARDFDRRGQGGAAEFARWLRRLDVEEPREAEAVLETEGDQVVRLMTIHQAKGLEFPVVVLVDLLRQRDNDTNTVVIDRTRGVLLPPLAGPGGHPLRHAGLEAYRERERGWSDAEAARLLYVACTRAADELVLLEGRACPKELAKEPGGSQTWCHKIWDVVGRDAVGAAATGAEAARVTLADGGTVSIEPASRFLRSGTRVELAAAEPRESSPTPAAVAAVERVLSFRPRRPREVATTPTALAAFARCPRQYWYRHVIGMQEWGRRGRSARLMGTLAHGVLERLDYAADPTEALLSGLVEARPESLQLTPSRIDEVLRDLTAAAALVREEIGRGLTIIAREEAVTLGLPAERPEVVLHGRIDVLARRCGALVVQDYKYAEASGARTAEYAPQLDPYRLAVARLTGEPVAGEIVFVRGTPRLVPLPPLDARRTEAALLDTGRALALVVGERDAEAFPRRPTDPAECRALGCGFVRRCFGHVPRMVTGSVPDGPGHSAGA